MDASLILELRSRALDPTRATDSVDVVPAQFHPTLNDVDISEAENALGFPVPAAVRGLYTSVANGGFGPAYGLLGLIRGATNEDRLDAVHLYLRLREPDEEDPHWSWPECLLPLGHLGCGMLMCVDCSRNECPLVWFEPNPHAEGQPWTDSFIPFPVLLQEWLRRWLAGEDDLFEDAWNAASASAEPSA